MNQHLKLVLALTTAACLGSGVAVAQSNTPAGTTGAAPSGSTAPSGVTSTPGAMKGSSADQVSMPTKTDSASSAFNKLSTKHPGYVSSEDVAKLPGFDFKSADKNNDGKLDQSEFNEAWTKYSGTK